MLASDLIIVFARTIFLGTFSQLSLKKIVLFSHKLKVLQIGKPNYTYNIPRKKQIHEFAKAGDVMNGDI